MKTKTVLLRGVEIGAGRPKIIVPIVGKTEQEILDKAAELVQAKPDVVEWRVDYFQGVGDVQRVVDTARELNEALGEIPILFTFRTKREGGEKEIGMEDYTALNRAVAQSSYVDAVDVEIFSGDEVVRKNIAAIHDAGAAVVGSSHEFHRTPEHAELIYRLYKFGSEGPSFDPITISGPNTSLPHGVPSERELQYGDFVTMDFGCLYHGYCSDMTRTIALGYVSEKMDKVYHTVLEAQLAGIAATKAGVTGKAMDAAARKVIDDAGFVGCFGHSYGHSLGLLIHEAPNASMRNDKPMPAGAVVSAEPGIYIPDEFGVRIEDVTVITDTGCEILTKSPKNLIIL